MVGINDFNEDTSLFHTVEISISRPIRFWLLLLLDIPSISCTIFILYHLFIDRSLRNQLNNHSIIILLIFGLTIELIDIPLNLNFISNSGIVKPSNSFLCRSWWMIDVGFYNGITIIMSWSAFERHILVFHDQWISTRRKRFLIHYLPLILLLFYINIFYFIVIFFPSCNNIYNYTLPVCNNFPCYLNDPFLGKWDSLINSILPTILISFFIITLIYRVYRQKRRLHQPIRWRKQRKLIIQLVPISILYLIVNIPLNLLIFVHLCGLSKQIAGDIQLYFDFLCYLLILIFPFFNFASLSEIRKKTKLQQLFSLRSQRRIAITTAHT
uniref:G-protein coupled receptors family 1 profile domain-containing protein n=1 Tax=Adineta vaga TaxID=104782 RepID=B3G4Q2_ADIVA|nr:unknown [Adineta vaga]